MSSQMITLYLTNAQYKKYSTGKAFQLSYQQIMKADHTDGKHQISIQLDKKDYRKLLRNVKAERGFRFSSMMLKSGGNITDEELEMEGEGIISDTIAKGKRIAKRALKDPRVKSIARTALSIGKDALKGVANQTGFADYLNPAIDTGAQKVDEFIGNGLAVGGKLVKGSVAMKEKMARLRSMRKGSGMVKETLPVGYGVGAKMVKKEMVATQALKNGINPLASVIGGVPNPIKKGGSFKAIQSSSGGNIAGKGLRVGGSF